MNYKKYIKHTSNEKNITHIYNGSKDTVRYMSSYEFDNLCKRISKKYDYIAASSFGINMVRILKRKIKNQ